MDRLLGHLLRAGVGASALVVLAGGAVFLARHGSERFDRGAFRSEPGDLRSPAGIAEATLAGRGRGLIQLGLLLLIATPVARVAFSAIVFARQGDRTYVILTLVVLAVLVYALFFSPRGP